MMNVKENMRRTSSPEVESAFRAYPDWARKKLLELRRLILEVANEEGIISHLEETLKWGEPSYLTEKGSTIRLGWKARHPDQYAIYFKCTSKLVPAFRDRFGDVFEFEGNRAIVFRREDEVPVAELKQCIKAGLRYHRVKQLPGLGLE